MIGESGIDTIYASLNMAFMSAEQETYDFAVTGHTVKTSVTFYVPKLVFVESETSSKQISGDDPTEERFVGPMYTFYILALAPSMTNPGSSVIYMPLNLGLIVSNFFWMMSVFVYRIVEEK